MLRRSYDSYTCPCFDVGYESDVSNNGGRRQGRSRQLAEVWEPAAARRPLFRCEGSSRSCMTPSSAPTPVRATPLPLAAHMFSRCVSHAHAPCATLGEQAQPPPLRRSRSSSARRRRGRRLRRQHPPNPSRAPLSNPPSLSLVTLRDTTEGCRAYDGSESRCSATGTATRRTASCAWSHRRSGANCPMAVERRPNDGACSLGVVVHVSALRLSFVSLLSLSSARCRGVDGL